MAGREFHVRARYPHAAARTYVIGRCREVRSMSILVRCTRGAGYGTAAKLSRAGAEPPEASGGSEALAYPGLSVVGRFLGVAPSDGGSACRHGRGQRMVMFAAHGDRY